VGINRIPDSEIELISYEFQVRKTKRREEIMKQIELAQQLGISKSYLSMILSGQRTPNPELARRLSSLEVHNFEAGFSLRGRCLKPLDECAIY